MKQYSREVAQMTKEQINFLKYLDVFKTRLPKHFKRAMADNSLSQENVDGLEGLKAFVMDDLSEIVGYAIPFLGAHKAYEAGEEGMAWMVLGIDVWFLVAAIMAGSTAIASGPIAVAWVIATMFVKDVGMGAGMMGTIEWIRHEWDEAVEFYAPQLSIKHKRLDYIEQKGFKND
jgi:hypothetical protein